MYKPLTSMYSPSYPTSLVQLLKKSHYQEKPYIKELWKIKDFSVHSTKNTKLSRKESALLQLIRLSIIIVILIGAALIYFGIDNKITGGVEFGIALIILYPMLISHLITIPIILRRWYKSASVG